MSRKPSSSNTHSEEDQPKSRNHSKEHGDDGGASTPAGGAGGHDSSSELFSVLSAMHLTSNGHVGGQSRKRKILDHGGHGSGSSGSGKLNPLRPPGGRRGSEVDEDLPLHTPQCSQSGKSLRSIIASAGPKRPCSFPGYADEEDHHQSLLESNLEDAHAVHPPHSPTGQTLGHSIPSRIRNISLSALVNHHTLMSDIDENLATDFDGSFSGLGVDINASNYSMSEALMALPNLSISSSQMFKQEAVSPVPPATGKSTFNFKDEPSPHSPTAKAAKSSGGSASGGGKGKRHSSQGRTTKNSANGSSNGANSAAKNLEALDLSNDEAHFPETVISSDAGTKEGQSGPAGGSKTTFTGSVSRESSSDGKVQDYASPGHFVAPPPAATSTSPSGSSSFGGFVVNFSGSHPNLSLAGASVPSTVVQEPKKTTISLQPDRRLSSPTSAARHQSNSYKTHKVILPLQPPAPPPLTKSSPDFPVDLESSKFQYILAAQTSNATKIHEPSITYLNQGQAYELRLKKLGDLSQLNNRLLLCKVRICFHERRLQYMELEQLMEWSAEHPRERVLDLDIPLSYGIINPYIPPSYDATQINTLSFRWDPTRDTGAFIKVNCISTEFTPKKHGGEKGVPFRLQVETYQEDPNADEPPQRIHAASCVLQIFKLKGADRKHKQDREKISKRPVSEQEKFSPSYDCTVLSDLQPENVYVPTSESGTSNKRSVSRSNTPNHLQPGLKQNHPNPVLSQQLLSRDGSPVAAYGSDKDLSVAPSGPPAKASPTHNAPPLANGLSTALTANSTPDMVTSWLSKNRFGNFLPAFRNYNGRDMLRLLREEIITLCGMSDGIRLYNELHLVPVAPVCTFYIAPKGANEYSALFLEEATVDEFIRCVAGSVGLPVSIFAKVFVLGPNGIIIRVTNSVVEFTKPETVFQFTLRPTSDGNGASGDHGGGNTCDIILEDVAPLHGIGDQLIGQNNDGGGYAIDHQEARTDNLVLQSVQNHAMVNGKT